jgi:hypothetical protein
VTSPYILEAQDWDWLRIGRQLQRLQTACSLIAVPRNRPQQPAARCWGWSKM